MKNTSAKLFLALLLAVCGFSQGARAEESRQLAFLECNVKANSFTVVLLNSGNEGDMIEDAINKFEAAHHEEGLKRMPDSSCVLANNHHIEISTKQGALFPYGRGGADPDLFFTLRVDNRAVFYNYIFYKGYGNDEGQIVTTVNYANGALKACGSAFNGCADVSNRLNGNALTDEEKAERSKDNYARSLNRNLSPFCKGIRHNLEVRASSGHAKRSAFPIAFFDFDKAIYVGENNVSKGALDLNNDGHQDLVYRVGSPFGDCVSCGNHYFDGSFLILSNETAAEKEGIQALLANKEFKPDDTISGPVSPIPGLQSLMISGGHAGSSPRYVYNLPFKQGNKTYIYSFESNYTNVPSASVNLLTPDNKLETICLYAGRSPH